VKAEKNVLLLINEEWWQGESCHSLVSGVMVRAIHEVKFLSITEP